MKINENNLYDFELCFKFYQAFTHVESEIIHALVNAPKDSVTGEPAFIGSYGDFAEYTGRSRSPKGGVANIRKALIALEEEGWIKIEPIVIENKTYKIITIADDFFEKLDKVEIVPEKFRAKPTIKTASASAKMKNAVEQSGEEYDEEYDDDCREQ